MPRHDLGAFLRVTEAPFEVENPHPVGILDVTHRLGDAQSHRGPSHRLDMSLYLFEHSHIGHAR